MGGCEASGVGACELDPDVVTECVAWLLTVAVSVGVGVPVVLGVANCVVVSVLLPEVVCEDVDDIVIVSEIDAVFVPEGVREVL